MNCNDSNHTIVTYEAVFDKAPFATPANKPRVNLEPLERLEILTTLGNRIAYDGKRFVLSCNAQYAGTNEPMDAAYVGERKIASVVDVAVEIQIVRPDAELNARCRK